MSWIQDSGKKCGLRPFACAGAREELRGRVALVATRALPADRPGVKFKFYQLLAVILGEVTPTAHSSL